jgi:hypothetical protein
MWHFLAVSSSYVTGMKFQGEQPKGKKVDKRIVRAIQRQKKI